MPDGNADDHGSGHHDRHGDVTSGDWVSIGEAAHRLGVTRAAIYGRIERRTLTTRPKGNRGLEVLLPTGGRHGDHHRDIRANDQGDRHGDGQPDVALTSRLEELLERA